MFRQKRKNRYAAPRGCPHDRVHPLCLGLVCGSGGTMDRFFRCSLLVPLKVMFSNYDHFQTMLRIFGQTIPSDCVEGTQCFEDFLHRGLEPWRNDHGTTTDPVMTVTITTSSFNMEVNEAKMAIYILSGCILSLCE